MVGRPILPEDEKKNNKLTFTMTKEEHEFIGNFTQKGKSIRTIIFHLMPKMFKLFASNGMEADFTDEEIKVLTIYKEMIQ